MQNDGAKKDLNNVTSCVNEHNKHPSIESVKKRMGQLEQIKYKKTQKTDILVKVLKNERSFVMFVTSELLKFIMLFYFPAAMKFADVNPIHKKEDKTDKQIIYK